MKKSSWRSNRSLEIPGLKELFIESFGATLSAYPENRKKKPFTWEVEMGDFYKHGREKTMNGAQAAANLHLRLALMAALYELYPTPQLKHGLKIVRSLVRLRK